jgi:hypothetical protein
VLAILKPVPDIKFQTIVRINPCYNLIQNSVFSLLYYPFKNMFKIINNATYLITACSRVLLEKLTGFS